ncbi:LPXTG cell wall anchor domain-containing protein [uncultured Streptococcus sp.]|uniref:LPXTG cell wall anchor domain-containing protein n=1 Tax=uncultured Streptococcus sp. TaxID=83427 RepID=UPI0028E7EF54|nr:LPXTG cell wall anchor domain-containing protein [uncultured Streptococcus sp.]
MNKLTKLGIVTFSAVTLSAAVPTLVHAEENVAPQPNAAARPTIQPTLTPKPNSNWVDYSMLDPIAKPKPKPGKEVSKPANSNKNETPTDETTGKSASKPKEELKSVDEKTRLAELKTKYDVDPSNKEIDTTLTMSAAEIVKGLNTEEDKKRTETLAAAGVASSIVEHDAIVFEETRKAYLSTGVDITKPPFTKSNPNDPYEAVAAVVLQSEPKYIIKAIYMDAAKLKKFGYTEKAHVSDITPSELSYPNGEKFEGGYTLVDSYNHHINSVQEGSNIKLVGTKWDYDEIQRNSNAHIKELVAPEIKGYTFSHVEKARDLPDLSTDPRVVKVDYESIYHMHGGKSVLDSSFYLDILHYYFIYNKDEIAKEIPNPEINNIKPAEDTTLKPASNPVANTQPTANPTPTPKPTENPQTEVKPAEQPQPTQPVKPAENKPVENKPAETPVPAPKPAENPQPEVKPTEQPQENNRKPVRRWHLRDGSVQEHPVVTYADIVAPLPISDMKETPINGIWTAEKDFINNKPRLAYFIGSANRWIEENGREFSLEEMRKSHVYMYPIRVKIPELEGRNYEAYTIYTGIFDGKTGHVELNKNTNITGQGYMAFRTTKEDNDVEVYQFSKNRQVTPLYGRSLNERGRSEGDFGLYAEVYQTYVFLFKNHTEKPADQAKPEVKPSENPVNPVTPVAPITPTTPVTPTLNPAIPNNTRVLSSIAGNVQVYGSEATLKNVRYIRVEETKSNSLESKKYKAFDIHLYDARGKAIQPNGWVTVSVLANQPVENVYYVNQNGSLFALDFKQNADKVTFETNHFSIYAMTFKVAASRDNGGSTTPVPVVNSSNTPTTTEQKGNDVNSTKTQAEPLVTKTETISKQVAKTLPNTGENNSILATLFGMLTLTAGLFSFRKESE